jgi:MazG family protein
MHSIEQLLQIMAQLRDPEKGCPWDLRQTYSTIVPYTIEEAYEVADAIEKGDMHELRDELGDLLFQVVFYSQIAKEEGYFDFNDVTRTICDKMLRRHPHVFADATYESEDELHKAWEQGKAEERSNRGAQENSSELDGIARALPALMRAEKLQRRAARVGFDWPDVSGAIAKLSEELDEMQAELKHQDMDRVQDELGDLLFTVVNVIRLFGMNAEQTLKMANEKFENRFRETEQALFQRGVDDLHKLTIDEWDVAWEEVKSKKEK